MAISGYMSACWRALATQPGIELEVLAFGQSGVSESPFADAVVSGFPCTLIAPEQARDPAWVSRWVAARRPDIVVVCGWGVRGYRRLVTQPGLHGAKFVLGMDNPWRAQLRQRLAGFLLRGYLRKMSKVVVSGERSWQYARRLGVPEKDIRRGLYGIDFSLASAARDARLARPGGWPRTFLYVGRLEESKGIETLLGGYEQYRRSVADPWELVVSGAGPLVNRVKTAPGVRYLGFVQPNDLSGVWAEAGAFVLASVYDPWPLVLVEACGAGLPVVHTEACGSAVELVRPYYNGLSVATGDGLALARGLRWVHGHADLLPLFGQRSREFARAYSAEAWAGRWVEWLDEILGNSR